MAVDPYSDPQFLAFQRALGTNDAELAAAAQAQKDQVGIQQQSRLPDYSRQLENGQRDIADDFESRGVHSSGVRVQRQNEQAGDVQRRMYQDLLGTQGQQGDIDMQLAQQQLANRRKDAEAYLTSSSKTALSNASGILSPMIGA